MQAYLEQEVAGAVSGPERDVALDMRAVHIPSSSARPRLIAAPPTSELREWRIQLRDVRVSLLPEFEVADSASRVHIFSLSYIFTSGSSDSHSGEQEWCATTTRMRLPGHVARGHPKPHELCWGSSDVPQIYSDHIDGQPVRSCHDTELPTIVHHGAFWEVPGFDVSHLPYMDGHPPHLEAHLPH